MKPGEHEELGELLSAYLDGEVTADERARIEQLLASDKEAKALYDALRKTVERLHGAPRESAPPYVLDAINARLERETLLASADQNVVLARHRRPPWRSTLAVAAMLAIAIGGGLYVSLKLAEHEQPIGTLAQRDNRSLETQPVEKDAFGRKAGGETPRSAPQSAVDGSGGGFGGGGLGPAQSDLYARAKEAAPRDSAVSSEAETALADVGDGKLGLKTRDLKDEDLGETVIADATERLMRKLGATAMNEPAAAPDFAGTNGAVFGGATVDRLAFAKTPLTDREARSDKSAIATRRAGIAVKSPLAQQPPAGPTFEQCLRAGAARDALAAHRFADEPVQLRVRFRTASGEQAYRQHIERLLAERGASDMRAQLDDASSEGAPDDRQSLVNRAARAAVPAENQRLYLEGTPGVNFAAQPTTHDQVLARVPADWLIAALDEAAARDAESVTLGIGALTADGPNSARKLAQRMLNETSQSPAAASQAPVSLTDWLERFRGFTQIVRGGRQPDQAREAEAGAADGALGLPESRAGGRSALAQTPLITVVVDLSANADAGSSADPDK